MHGQQNIKKVAEQFLLKPVNMKITKVRSATLDAEGTDGRDKFNGRSAGIEVHGTVIHFLL
jgi:hypothetical protein